MVADIYSKMTWLSDVEQAYLRQYDRRQMMYKEWLDYDLLVTALPYVAPRDRKAYALAFGEMFQQVLYYQLMPQLMVAHTQTMIRLNVRNKTRIDWPYRAPELGIATLQQFGASLSPSIRALIGLDDLLVPLPTVTPAMVDEAVMLLPPGPRLRWQKPAATPDIVRRVIAAVQAL